MPYDIAVNITDPQYLGEYNSKKKHCCDIKSVIARGKSHDINMVFLGLSLASSVEVISIANEYNEYCVIGVHPGSTEECTKEDIQAFVDILSTKTIENQRNLIRKEVSDIISTEALLNIDSVVGIGEVGLDYNRTYSSKEKQKKVFKEILKKTEVFNLPYIFHYRDCEEDFFEIVNDHNVSGVIHSYTGGLEEMRRLVSKGFYIGINGASIRENEQTSVIEEIPLDRLLIETDAPWCTIRKTSKYYDSIGTYLKSNKKWIENEGVKGRNEPINLYQVIDAVSHIKKTPKQDVISVTNQNFKKLFRR
ncbi:TatD DNase family protein [Nematocida parisii]|uniref:TatD DNase n=1 Tax=Nematocida parisii (strain ERTm3) TaxID=935791 RepID=I3EG77_NEMP3|nr:uncharacterized protein NEPG_01281 [Nematocida parisii ERTm1]EIJ88224.1 hypothetical protein NEQG_01668 [Nematocida parisii ERTm3]KAI5125356.1 TatD DNase family protein [Nematocida parisii]EIJ93709.1 hypothetical protein NEPG_01281 [Nematocida parisii ERTm1]KAI5125480.1 TatD DNase family protein [Nematocida parisii]KAI5140638.1 TatD DNase family protein [Nematocida parisii]|eukprot:XP_013059109.1 hypothetical protein NEPG_01281 [Nematocida parisii ERTm1]